MKRILFLLCVAFAVPSAYQSSASTSTGSVELDELSFDKIINKFHASLVKFDVAFPYGDKHDAFVALAKEAKHVDDLLIAEVGVKEYGERDNEALAKKYGATKENFPVVKLFIQGVEPIPFDESNGFSTDALRQFVRDKGGVYLSLPGCVRELDKLAMKFMESKDRQAVFKEAKAVLKDLPSKDNTSVKIYKTIMEKILQKGDEFVTIEFKRVQKIMSGKLSEEKKKEMATRVNILQTFQLQDKRLKEDL